MRSSPAIKVIAPWREWDLNSRTTLIDYAERHGIPVPVTTAKPYSTDRNLFHISYEGGILEDPWKEPPAEMFVWCRPVEKAPDRAEYVEIDYERGDPVARGRRAACRRPSCWRGSTTSAPSTASAGSTWSRTVTSA